MNNLLALVTEVCLEPKDRNALCALIDVLEEEQELPHAAAVRRAVTIRRQAKWDLLAGQAREVIAVHSPYYIDIREEMRDSLSIPRGAYMTLGIHRARNRFTLASPPTTEGPFATWPHGYHVTLSPRYALALKDVLDRFAGEDPYSEARSILGIRRRRGGQHDGAA